MKKIVFWLLALLLVGVSSCDTKKKETVKGNFMYEVDEFADLQILRYQVPGFDSLSLQQKELIYYLSQAALEGRDILFDQNNRHNLAIRRTLEAIYTNYGGDKGSSDFKNLEVYLKRVWFSNGIHHHYGQDKFMPGFGKDFFVEAVKALPENVVPKQESETIDQFVSTLADVMFNPEVMAKKINQSGDVIATSANNYYGDNITQAFLS